MSSKTVLWLLNIVGGIAVLGSYVVGLSNHPGQGMMLWGEIPEGVRGPYTAMMFPAAFGYITAFAYVVTQPQEALDARLAGGLQRYVLIQTLFLVSAALWMPLCWVGIDNGLPWMVWPIQAVLAVTGAGAAYFVWQFAVITDPDRPLFRKAALIGSCFLALQCTVIDGLIWPRFFSIAPLGL